MIKINYKELPKYLNDDHLYQLRNAYTDADIVYPVETYRLLDRRVYYLCSSQTGFRHAQF